MGLFEFIPDLNVNDENPENKLPTYNYQKNISKPIKLKKKATAFDGVYSMIDNIHRSTGNLITGKEKGSQYDMRLGERTFYIAGTCGPDSTNNCYGKPRHIIINNLPSGNFNRNTDYSRGSNQNGKHAGIIPSLIEDILDLNPMELIDSVNGESKSIHSKCHEIEFEEKQFVHKDAKSRDGGVQSLTKIHTICTPIPKRALNRESFTSNHKKNHKKNLCYKNLCYKYIIVAFVFLFLSYFLWSNKYSGTK